MCDYSLHGLPSRLAVQGEELVARRFCTSTIGLASPAELGRFIGSASDRKGHWWSLISAETLPQVASEPQRFVCLLGLSCDCRTSASFCRVSWELGRSRPS